jgi:hypothetical protein
MEQMEQVEQVAGVGDGNRQTHPAAHEERDVRIGAIVRAAVSLAAVSALTFVAMAALMGHLARREARLGPAANPLAATYALKTPPEPRLQPAPIRDLEALRAREDALLGSYAWIDRDAGIVRIPIERAMEILSARAAGPARPRRRSEP